SFAQPVLEEGSTFLVPLEEFAPLVGLDVSQHEGRVILRGDGFRQSLDESIMLVLDGAIYVALDWLLDHVNGELHWLGGDAYVQIEEPRLVEIDATAQQVTVRFTGFSPHSTSVSSQGQSEVLRLRWPFGLLDVDAQLIRVGEADIQEVRLVGSGNGVELSVMLEPGTLLALTELETDDFYSLELQVAQTQSHQSVIMLGDGVSVSEWADIANGRFVDYVYVESWRNRFRLVPTVAADGYEIPGSLEANLEVSDAVAAISIDCPWVPMSAECLIMNDIPYAVPDTPCNVLAMDLFGRWTTFSSLCAVDIKHAGQFIVVDGINRPLDYGEVVLYSSGYSGSIAQSIPGSFLALKIREGRIVSVYQGPFVPADSSAILVVASGEAKARLSLIRLGDPVDVICQFTHANGTYPYAVSAGPLVMGNGAVVLNEDQLKELWQWEGGAALACDWQGGLYLLSFSGSGERETTAAAWGLMTVVNSLPTTLKDVVLLSSCGRQPLAYSGRSGTFQLGPQDPIRLALSLIPLTP
ncbi:hypothetical protein IH601_10780, partial [Candidatus Bipolaricaulota bacterium]|nr:hypothetical protein [Candidatus Bipolaricaulota bacterium]